MTCGTCVWYPAVDGVQARVWGYELTASPSAWSVAVVGGVTVASGAASGVEAAQPSAEAHCGRLLTPRKPDLPSTGGTLDALTAAAGVLWADGPSAWCAGRLERPTHQGGAAGAPAGDAGARCAWIRADLAGAGREANTAARRKARWRAQRFAAGSAAGAWNAHGRGF
jgi:hypothetical protein